jgi:hypothetical protein
VKFTLDFRRRRFKLAVRGADFGVAGADVSVALTLGDDSGFSTRTWRASRRGFVL